MKNVARFEKVSLDQFIKDVLSNKEINYCISQYLIDNEITNVYNIPEIRKFIENEIYPNIILPSRSTIKSAGYDFKFPYPDYTLVPNNTITIPTGIKCEMNGDIVLTEHVRSGQGFKYQLSMSNTVGIIDADYYNNPTNEGHIFIKLINRSINNKSIIIEKDKGYCQGIFLQYGTVIGEDINNIGIRNGGFGSTDK